MPLTRRIPDRFFQQIAVQDGRWRWPLYRQTLGLGRPMRQAGQPESPSDAPPPQGFGTSGLRLSDLQLSDPLPALWSASFIEWRYYAILDAQFHGILGMALVNPNDQFSGIAESGLLTILAGRLSDDGDTDQSRSFSWMHLFPTCHCRFDPKPDSRQQDGLEPSGEPSAMPLCLDAEDHRSSGAFRLRLSQGDDQALRIRLDTSVGINLEMTQEVVGESLPPMLDTRLRDLPGGHWQVNCPAPLAKTSGRLRLGRLAHSQLQCPEQGCRASNALLVALSEGGLEAAWENASGYHEHSHGIRPLPLHGWDFLFAPDLDSGQTLVMQTYRGSKRLRYLDLRWRDAGGLTWQQHFSGKQLSWEWLEIVEDPLLGVSRPGRRHIIAEADGLRLEVDNRIEQGLPLLRPARLAVRHFYIHEELGQTDWVLKDLGGHILAQAQGVRSGGETAGFRWRTPDDQQ